jgi:hypothetical protein
LSAERVATRAKEAAVDKQTKTAAELEEIVKQRCHATIYGRQPAEVHRCQVMADTIVIELCQFYELAD